MRFISLYSYSLWKSPKELRWAIVACRIALILSAFSALLFLISGLALFQTTGTTRFNNQPLSTNNSSSEKIIQQNVPTTQELDTTVPQLQPFVWVCLLTAVISMFAVILTSSYALISYRTYRRSRMAAYEMVDRSFDAIQQQQLAKTKILEPIGEPVSNEAITVIKVEQKPTTTTTNKSTFWSRLKRFQHQPPSDHRHYHYQYRNSARRHHQDVKSKEMTI